MSSNGAVLLLGRDIFIIFSAGEMVEAVITLIASFYLMDLDYPSGLLSCNEFVLVIVQSTRMARTMSSKHGMTYRNTVVIRNFKNFKKTFIALS